MPCRLAASLGASLLAFSAAITSSAVAKTPGAVYCYNSICHRVHTLTETEAAIGEISVVTASYYDDHTRDRFTARRETSSGEIFDADAPFTVASPIWPNGTTLLIWSATTQQAAIVRVNDSGPYYGDRKIDLSRALAEEMGMAKQGVAPIHVLVLSAPTPEEARYKRNRVYPPVPGGIGSFGSLAQALAARGAQTSARLISSSSSSLRSMPKVQSAALVPRAPAPVSRSRKTETVVQPWQFPTSLR